MKTHRSPQLAHRATRTPSAGTSHGTHAEDKVDPKLFAAVSQVMRLVMDQQDQKAAAMEAEAAARQAKPERPAFRRLYDVPGAASQLSLSPSKTWALIKAGRLRAVKLDSRTLVTATELDRFATEEVHPA